MKYFPVKIVILCIILTPILYTTSLGVFEGYLEGIYHQQIENRIIGDATPILNGSIKVEDAVSNNIRTFVKDDFLIQKLGIEVDILVALATNGRLIYPYIDTDVTDSSIENLTPNGFMEDPAEVAGHNFEILNHELKVTVRVLLPHGTMGANLILLIYALLSLSLFLVYYKIGLEKARQHDIEKGARLSTLIEEERRYQQQLDVLENDRRQMMEKYETIKSDFQEKNRQASITEDEMFEEIVALEKKLNENRDEQKQQQEEIGRLREQLAKEEKKKGGGKKRKSAEMTEKRLATLYKNVTLHRKALSGLLDLGDEMQIKAEELIHQLNDEPAKVTIKRKVFSGKKKKTASFEVLFSYNGRLYFRNMEGNRVEVLVIGTKNSQDKDMEFLHDLG